MVIFSEFIFFKKMRGGLEKQKVKQDKRFNGQT